MPGAKRDPCAQQACELTSQFHDFEVTRFGLFVIHILITKEARIILTVLAYKRDPTNDEYTGCNGIP